MPFGQLPSEQPVGPAAANHVSGDGATKTIESERKHHLKPKFRKSRQGRKGQAR